MAGKVVAAQIDMFAQTADDTPLVSGVPVTAADQPFDPVEAAKQFTLPGIEAPTWNQLVANRYKIIGKTLVPKKRRAKAIIR